MEGGEAILYLNKTQNEEDVLDKSMKHMIHQGKRIEYLLLKSDRPLQTRLNEMGTVIKDMANEASQVLSGSFTTAVKQAEKKGHDVAYRALDTRTKKELYEMAQELDISGRGSMNKDELIEAILHR
jgi:hypothetical protein